MAENKKPMPMRPHGGMGGRFQGAIEKPQNRKGTLKRLLKYLASSKTLLIALVTVVVIYTVAHLYTNLLVKDAVGFLGTYNKDLGKFEIDPNPKEFYKSVILLGIFYAIYCILMYFSSLLGAYISTFTVRKMRNDLFNKIVYLPIGYTDTHENGDILSRMVNDVDNVSNAISQSLTSLISGILTIIGCVAIMLWYSPLLTLCSFAIIILTMIWTMIMGKFARPLFMKQQAVLGKLNTQTEEMVTSFKTVKTNNREMIAKDEFSKYSDEFTKTAIKAQILGGSMGPVMNFISNVGYFMMCIFGALFILKGIGNTLTGEPITVAIVIMFLTTSKQFTRPINEIAQLYTALITALAGAERVFAIMDEKEETFESKIKVDPNEIKGEIDFEHVEFSYDGTQKILNDFTLNVKAGHKIALVGATGSGKTTVVNLLLRFYDINGGVIKVDGTDIAEMSKKDLRDSVSIVLQDPVLFGQSIEDNIRYGRENATDEEVDDAIKFANCESFIKRLPDGKKTILTEGATNISQGQRQLLTIARAVIADPKILILDEATSSVDTRTEKKIQDAMVKLMANRTSIIIAHRLSTIQDADLIVVMDKGNIVESGNHKELLAIDGVYKKLYDTQFRGLEI